MVEVGIVGVEVAQPRVPVPMDMRLAAVRWGVVRVLVVRIMYVLVGVLQLFVHMRVVVMFRQVQPHAERH